MFVHTETRGSVEVAFTDRHGGVSQAPYASLNLAASGGDDPDAVAENLRRLRGAFTGSEEAPVALMHQVHGDRVVEVDEVRDAAPACDGLLTVTPGLTLLVRAADCVPVLLADPGEGLVAAVHAGRPGLLAGVVPAAVAALRARGATELVAWVGPHVCGRCYEVPEGLRAEVAAAVPASFAETSWGTPSLDLGAGVRAQLDAAAVGEVVEVGRCTREDPDLYSYRRDGAGSGRHAGLVRVRP